MTKNKSHKQPQLIHASLFSGIGGFDLAADWAGWQNAFHCEYNKFGQKILKHYWPNAESYGDITKTNFTVHRGTIDVLTGGFPCQPYSIAGKRKGKGDERHLWPEMLRAIREVSPAYVVGENVHGIVNWAGGLVFNEVQTDLENEGYEVQPVILPACAVNAPHRRDRVWFVAYNNMFRNNSTKRSEKYKMVREQPPGSEQTRNGRRGKNCGFVNEQFVANPNASRFKECWPKWFTSREFVQNYGFTSEPVICRGNDGFPYRVDRLKALGNAIVPQVAYQIFKAINMHEVSLRNI